MELLAGSVRVCWSMKWSGSWECKGMYVCEWSGEVVGSACEWSAVVAEM